jgi:hypothetical protein
VTEEPVVYIDRLYDDPFEGPQPWRRRRRISGDPHEWTASTGGTTDVDEESRFDTVDQAIAWGRERAEVILVRLGGDLEAIYSAGTRHAAENTDGSGWRFPLWPPASWPSYSGPPEPGWPVPN